MIGFQESLSQNRIEKFCRDWKIIELSLFGSILRPDYDQESDIDILVKFSPEAEWSLLDHVQMEQELEEILGRRVDLVSRKGIERSRNTIRKKEILETAERIYVER